MAQPPKFDKEQQKQIASALREIPLEVVFESFGAERDPQDITRNWKSPAGRYSTKGNMFFNHDAEKGGAGALDLAMSLGQLTFPQAVAHLAHVSGIDATVSTYQADARQRVGEIVKVTPAPPAPKTAVPDPVIGKLPQVRKYLIETRGIAEEVVNKSVEAGRLWADKYGNAVFALSDPALTGERFGAELRGTFERPFHGVRGEKKGLFFTGNVKEKNVVFTESAIESMSYQTLAAMNVEVDGKRLPTALVVGITGSSKATLLEAAGALEKRGFKLHAGFNNDKDGQRYATWLDENFKDVQKLVPGNVKDWNLLLVEQRKQEREKVVTPAKQINKAAQAKELDVEPDR